MSLHKLPPVPVLAAKKSLFLADSGCPNIFCTLYKLYQGFLLPYDRGSLLKISVLRHFSA